MFYMTDDEIDKIFPVDDGWSDIDKGNAIGKRQGAKWMRDKLFGNVPKAHACPQLADVRTDGICFICKKPTQNLSPDPTNWRIDLPFNGGNGLTRQYHQGCLVALIDKHCA